MAERNDEFRYDKIARAKVLIDLGFYDALESHVFEHLFTEWAPSSQEFLEDIAFHATIRKQRSRQEFFACCVLLVSILAGIATLALTLLLILQYNNFAGSLFSVIGTVFTTFIAATALETYKISSEQLDRCSKPAFYELVSTLQKSIDLLPDAASRKRARSKLINALLPLLKNPELNLNL